MHSTRASTPTRPDRLPKSACPSICSDLSADKPRSSLERARCGTWKERWFRQPKNSCVCDCKVDTALLIGCILSPRPWCTNEYSLQGKEKKTTQSSHVYLWDLQSFCCILHPSEANYHRRSRCRSPTHLHIPRRSLRVHRRVPRAHQSQ